jgi:hypothetical protein
MIPRISIDMQSRLRAEVAIELKAGCARRALFAHGLRHRDPKVPRIFVVVEAKAGDNCVSIRVDIPADQPLGTYTGIVVDAESNLPQGSLTVHVVGATGRS